MPGVCETGLNIAALQSMMQRGADPSQRLCGILPSLGYSGPFTAFSQGWAGKPIASVVGGKKGGGQFAGALSWGDFTQTPISELVAMNTAGVEQTSGLVAPPTPSGTGGSSGGGIEIG